MKKLIRCVCILMVFVILTAVPVYAVEGAARSSAYISSYSCYLSKTSSTTFAVWFDVVGIGMMDEIGVYEIRIQRSKDCENWTTVHNYYSSDYPQMYCEDSNSHIGSMIYTGEKGYYYRARVTFYGEKGNGRGELMAYTAALLLPNTGRQVN